MSEVAQESHRWHGLTVLDAGGENVGRVAEVYLDGADDRPAWLVVGGGPFRVRKMWVPVVGVRLIDGRLHTPFRLDQIREATSSASGSTLDPEREVALYHHYGMATTVDPEPGPQPSVGESEVPGGPDDAMTRSEEQLVLRRFVRPAERVRLVKHVVVEERRLTIRLRREELRLERVPYGPGESSGEERLGELAEAEETAGEIVLYEEHPVVGKKVVPRERVSLVKSTVTEDRTVRADVAREEIEVEEEPLR